MSRDLFDNKIIEAAIKVNIYADEIQSKICSDTGNEWHYIGLIVEDINNPLLDDIIQERFMGNFDKTSPYYVKNNHIMHWSEIENADEKNICRRWFEYILNPAKSEKKFYSYILGLNNSYLSTEEFNQNNEFNSKYNRFFRSALLYALKTFFGNKKIIVENIYHEVGQQKQYEYFPWHCIYKISEQEEDIIFNCKKIIFLPKDHKVESRSNLIQLCDCVLGVTASIIHGIEKSNKSKYREELADVYLPLLSRLIDNPKNKNSSYKYYNRIMVRFFPKKKTDIGDPRRYMNQFYTNRNLKYVEEKSGQGKLPYFHNYVNLAKGKLRNANTE